MIWRIACLAFLFLAAPLASQDVLCPYTSTATGGTLWTVVVDDSVVSSHTRQDKAVERAAVEETWTPGRSVRVVPGELRIECPEDWAPPVADTVVDTMTVGSPGTVDDLETHQPTDTGFLLTWTEVGDGLGNPAWYEVRVREEGDTTTWIHPDQVVTEGTCAIGTVQGDGIGTSIECTVEGLEPSTTYESFVRAYRLSGAAGGG